MSKALAIIGNGLGNLIEQSVLPITAARYHSQVDIWTPRSSAEAVGILNGLSCAARIYSSNGVPPDSYDVVYTSWLMQHTHKQVRSRRVINVPQPRANNQLSEAAHFIKFAFNRRLDVSPYCAYAPAIELPTRGRLNIALSCGSKTGEWKIKRYPHFVQLAANLHAKFPNANFYLLGVAADDAVEHPAVTDLRSKYSLLETCGIIKQCDLMISNDSGLAHAAAALRVPTLVLFGPTQAAKNTPLGAVGMSMQLACQPCQYRSKSLGTYPTTGFKCQIECLQQLPPEAVAEQAVQMLQNKLAAT